MDVAWLAYTFAGVANGSGYDGEVGLQAAIWHVIYGVALTSNNTAGAIADYNADLAALAALGGNVPDYTADLTWLSPNGNDPNVMQGLLTDVPDGGMTLMLLGGSLVGIGTLRRKFRV